MKTLTNISKRLNVISFASTIADVKWNDALTFGIADLFLGTDNIGEGLSLHGVGKG